MTAVQRSPNRDRLLHTARLLRPLLVELVFVGGQVAELLVTDPAAVRVRPTDDVDVVVPVTTRTAYHALQLRLMTLGFTPDHRDGAPVCRMRTADDLLLDVMPLDYSGIQQPVVCVCTLQRHHVDTRANTRSARRLGRCLSRDEVGGVRCTRCCRSDEQS